MLALGKALGEIAGQDEEIAGDAEMAGQTSLRQVHGEAERKEQEEKIGGWVSEVLEHMSKVLLVYFSLFFLFLEIFHMRWNIPCAPVNSTGLRQYT